MEPAQEMELAEKNVKTLHRTNEVYRVSGKPNMPKPSQGQPRECYRCGGKHMSDYCRFKEAICHYCKKQEEYEKPEEKGRITEFIGLFYVEGSNTLPPYVLEISLMRHR